MTAVVGEPGVGKSRLVFELTHSHRVDGWLALESGSVSYGKATSYLPIIDLLKGYFRIGDRDTYRDTREKVTGKILTLDRSLEPALPALLALLDVPVDDLQWQALDPPQRTLDTVKRLLLREAQVQPLLVIFEDLHWIDSETQAFLDSLVESLPAIRMLLLVNYRPEYSHSWGGKTFYTQVRLDTLPPESASELLDALLGPDVTLEPLKSLLARTTGGNPLFLEESVRTLVEAKALLGPRGAYRLAQPVETIRVPPTVHAILAARIDRLSLDEKRLLETAAVIGKDVPFALLQAVAGESEETLRRGLGHLQAAEFLYETSLPDLEYTFKHALTHQVAYDRLLHDRRRNLHVRLVETLETLYADRIPEYVEALAYHALRGEAWHVAAAYSRQAGVRAFARAANRAAITYLEAGTVGLDPRRIDPASSRTGRGHPDRASTPSLRPGRSGRHLRAATRSGGAGDALGDRARLGRVLTFLANYFWFRASNEEALETCERVVSIATDLGEMGLRATAYFRRGQEPTPVGQYHRALQNLGAASRSFEGDRLYERFGGPTPTAVTIRLVGVVVRRSRSACRSDRQRQGSRQNLRDRGRSVCSQSRALRSRV